MSLSVIKTCDVFLVFERKRSAGNAMFLQNCKENFFLLIQLTSLNKESSSRERESKSVKAKHYRSTETFFFFFYRHDNLAYLQ